MLGRILKATTVKRIALATSLFSVAQAQAIKVNKNQIIVDILDPETLVELESRSDGYQMAELFTQLEWGVLKKRKNNSDFKNNSPLYNSLVGYISQSLDKHKQQYKVASQGEYTETSSFSNNPRSFSAKWLSTPKAKYELVAVVNRADRQDMVEHNKAKSNCGEVRFIYRLAYDIDGSHSRLPFTANMVYEVPLKDKSQPHKSCVKAAQKFKSPKTFTDVKSYANWLAQNPLNLKNLTFKQIEINFQAVRLTSGLKDQLGGHAEYILAVLRPDSQSKPRRFLPAYLENTPDRSRIEKNPALKAELVDFIVDNAKQLESGNLSIPQKFLTNEAVSISTHGLHRKRNRPFQRLINPADLKDVNFNSMDQVNSAEALITVLDELTCSGCHQSRSVAGFHVFGYERPETENAYNSIAVGVSPHYIQDKKRRFSYNWRMIMDQAQPKEFSVRPLSFQNLTSQGVAATPGVGEPCLSKSDAKNHFKGRLAQNLICQSGLQCVKFSENQDAPISIGQCVSTSKPVAGSPCIKGTMDEDGRTRLDTLRGNRQVGCSSQGYRCLQPFQGTPSGMCARNCVSGNRQNRPGEICAYNANSDFESCAASNDFTKCQNLTGNRSMRMACGEKSPCREDYICQKIFSVSGSPVPLKNNEGLNGYCTPVYFMFQMRLDGHPVNKL